ncbi:glycosyltransferase family 4 protein [Shewanella sp. FJAT-51649]|uniref:glycosyltransferase family 4 protein n=1 Tax=Shewanella sp. FJAT-51649 TaxID=2864210 RepID=UPI001C65BF3C|nr:glycosyltransferase family 4 protein [Shewanella sp. FJAT-51649]QYJ72800.1 glycosyltransferase family 4 protein [Shewanella sp. FJAT-51649]
MMLINFSNQIAAGPKNISKNFIEQCLIHKANERFFFIIPDIDDFSMYNDTHSIKFLRVNRIANYFGGAGVAIFVNLFLIPKLLKEYEFRTILAFGNFLLPKFSGTKVVLLHHPYIVDDELFNSVSKLKKLSETIKRLAFRYTVKNVSKIVVQSTYMKNAFVKHYPHEACKVEIIHNPISSAFIGAFSGREANYRKNDTFKLIYVSRFYPHKNHSFLIDVARELSNRKANVTISVTLDLNILGVKDFLNTVEKENLPIINIFELPQAELVRHYSEHNAVIFPSESETFGNPLVEALFFGLPAVVPRKLYTESILGDCGVYYESNDIDSCIQSILKIQNNRDLYLSYSAMSLAHSSLYPNPKTWFDCYYSLLDGNFHEQR